MSQTQPKSESRPRPTPFDFCIEPSPIPGQRIPYPTIAHIDEELDLSVVIPVINYEHNILEVLQKASDYFDAFPSLTYEIMIVDGHSTDSTREKALDFAENHRSVRLLHIPRPVAMSSACLIALIRTRGRAIFLFNPLDGIPITAYSKYRAKLENVLKFSNRIFIVGQWKKIPENYAILRSAINIFLEWVLQKLFALAAVRESARNHARTFIMTREAIRAICMAMKMAAMSYDVEMLMLCAKLGIEVRAAKLDQSDAYKYTTTSGERADQVVIALQALITNVVRATQTAVQRMKSPIRNV
jgi:hypothetical protein